MDDTARWTEPEAAEIILRHAAQEGGLLPALHALQAKFGHVPRDVVPLLAEAFNLSRADVHGTLTFYHDFRDHPPGRHVLRLCRAESCQAMGGDGVAADLQARLGVKWGGTTDDDGVTLEPVYCLGLCAVSPSALLDGRPLGRIDADAVMDELDAVS